jgi:WD40-like Beta Propeller Repeat
VLISARRLVLGMLVSVCAFVGVSAFAGVVAEAAVTHEFLPAPSAKISEGVPAGSGAPLTGPLGYIGTSALTVDAGHLWVADHLTRVDRFDVLSGEFSAPQLDEEEGVSALGTGGVAVGHEEEVYVGAAQGGRGVVAVFGPSGKLQHVWSGANTLNGSFIEHGILQGVAVDGSGSLETGGDVYVATAGFLPAFSVVDVFRPEAGGGGREPSKEHITELRGTCAAPGTCSGAEVVPFSDPQGVVVSGFNGDVLVADGGFEACRRGESKCVVDVFEPVSGMPGVYSFLFKITGTPIPNGSFKGVGQMAVDGANGNIYVVDETLNVVDEFSATGVFLGQLTGTPTGAGGGVRSFSNVKGVAVDPVSERVFVGDYSAEKRAGFVDVFGRDVVVPDVVTEGVSGVTPTGAVLNGQVNPDNAGEASCWFVWGTTREFGQEAKCEPEKVAEGGSLVGVHAALANVLAPDTTYYYRLQASNKNGTNPGEGWQDQHFTTSGPGIHREAVLAVTGESVTFDASIDPHGKPTTYYFQYGRTSGYEAVVPLAPGGPLGSGEGDVEVSRHVQGLVGDTVYHYRVVAFSELAPGGSVEFDGADQTFTTQRAGGALSLPDGRQWEMVTPPHKYGAAFSQIEFESLIQASVGGDAMADIASQPTEAEPQGYGYSVLSTRGSGGWSSRVIATPHEKAVGITVGEGTEYRFFSEDLSRAIAEPFGGFTTPLSPEASESTPYLRNNYLNGNPAEQCTSGCYQPLVSAANVPPGTRFGEESCKAGTCGPYFLGASPDLSHIVLRSSAQLTSTPTGGQALYEWTGGQLKLVSVLPVGEVRAGPVWLGDYDGSARHAVSDDGSRVMWAAAIAPSGFSHLYVRDVARSETMRLDLPQGNASEGVSSSPEFMTASSDGSRIFFLAERLTEDSSFTGRDLYEYDLNAPVGSRLTDITVDSHVGEASRVAGVLGASEDGSYVYFAAAGALAPGAVHGQCGEISPSPGAQELCNLYVRHDGMTALVAVLSSKDHPDWSGDLVFTGSARVSPNGRWLAFMSNRSLTGYDTRDALSGRPDEEVYIYDAGAGRVVCASCNPTGARPVGVHGLVQDANSKIIRLVDAPEWGPNTWFAANVPTWTSFGSSMTRYQSRYLSDGGRLFFNSNDALVPQDVNGTQDVYEYEPVGVPAGGSYECTTGSVTFSERSGGCVGLVSAGSSPEESAFLDASGTGGDVFFLTESKLAVQDFDTARDVYDAHECSSLAPCFAQPPVSAPVCSTGDSCKAAPSPQPAIFGAPSSATFSGAGNVSAPGSARGVRARSSTRAQKLARALRACRKKGRVGRRVCERKARGRYAAVRSSKAIVKRGGGR